MPVSSSDQPETVSGCRCRLSLQGRRGLAEDVDGHAAAASAGAAEFGIVWVNDMSAGRANEFAAQVGHHSAESVGRDAIEAMDL